MLANNNSSSKMFAMVCVCYVFELFTFASIALLLADLRKRVSRGEGMELYRIT